jgi:hypothetical protein
MLLLALDQFGSLFSFDMLSFCHSGLGTLVTIELLVIEIIIRVFCLVLYDTCLKQHVPAVMIPDTILAF